MKSKTAKLILRKTNIVWSSRKIERHTYKEQHFTQTMETKWRNHKKEELNKIYRNPLWIQWKIINKCDKRNMAHENRKDKSRNQHFFRDLLRLKMANRKDEPSKN